MRVCLVESGAVASVIDLPDDAVISDDGTRALYDAVRVETGYVEVTDDGTTDLVSFERSVPYQAEFQAPEGCVLTPSAIAGPGWAWTKKMGFVPPPPPPLEPLKVLARRQVIAYANDITARITAAYPDAEVASWPTREAEARAVAAGQTLPEGAMLTALAAAAGQTQADYAARILAKAVAYRQVVVAVTVIREAAQAAIAAAATTAEIDEALATIKAQAEAKAAELGVAP